MKIYAFTFNGAQTDWVFAPNKKEAKEFYLGYTDCGDLDDCKITSVPQSNWAKINIVDPDDREPTIGDYEKKEYDNGLKITETFEDYAENNTVTNIIATTEF